MSRIAMSIFYPTESYYETRSKYNTKGRDLDLKIEKLSLNLSKLYNINLMNVPPFSEETKRECFMRLLAQNTNILMAWQGGKIEVNNCNSNLCTSRSSIELVTSLTESDWEYVAACSQKIIGYSDISFLLCALVNHGIDCYYGPNFKTTLLDSTESELKTSLEYMLGVLNQTEDFIIDCTDPSLNTSNNEPWTIVYGKATGRLVGGNLQTLYKLAKYCPDHMLIRKPGDIILLEDVEARYKMEVEKSDLFKKISFLKSRGFFIDVGGLIIGRTKEPSRYNKDNGKFVKINNQKEKPYIESILTACGICDMPILANVSCGHTHPMITLPLGRQITLNTQKKEITVHKK